MVEEHFISQNALLYPKVYKMEPNNLGADTRWRSYMANLLRTCYSLSFPVLVNHLPQPHLEIIERKPELQMVQS